MANNNIVNSTSLSATCDEEDDVIMVTVSSEDGDNNSSTFALETSQDDDTPALFRRPVLSNKNSSSICLDSSDSTSHPGAFRVAGMNRTSRQHSTRHDIPAQLVPLEDMSNSIMESSFEEPVAALTAVTVETPVMVDSGAVALVLSEPEEKQVSAPQRKRVFVWAMVLLVVLLTIVFCVSWFLHPGHQSEERFIAPTVAPSMSPTLSSRPKQVNWLVENDISNETDLVTNGSPQSKAVTWWTPEEDFHVSLQRYVLAVFYYAMGGERWEACGEGRSSCAPEGRIQNWLNHDTSECDWIGVSCDEMGVVIKLDFESLKATTVDLDNQVEATVGRIVLDGQIPAEIRHLSALQEFIAPSMEVQGSLDLWKDLVDLRVLNLENTALVGAISSQLDVYHPLLKVLNLRYNSLTGTLPAVLANMNSLQVLALDNNKLNGTIPSSLGLSSNLESLRLSGNQLRGQVPSNLFLSPELKELVLGANEALTGSIPTTIGNMSSLEVLDLHMTRMEGEIPPELFLGANLETLDLSHAQFHGVLTDDFRSLCGTLRVVRLNDNDFSGSIPAAFDECTRLEELDLSNTDITGEISEILCRERGTSVFQLSVLQVDCAVVCNCCGSRNCG